MGRRLIKIKTINVCGAYGIYYIENNNKIFIYVGSSKECNDSYSRHKHFLEKDKYKNTNKRQMQKIFNEEDLYFTILEECSEEDRLQIETKYINLYKDTIVNKEQHGKSRRSKPTIEETLKRRRANIGTRNPNCKYDIEIIMEIKEMINMGLSNTEISKKTGINRNYISQIRTGQKWSCVNILPI